MWKRKKLALYKGYTQWESAWIFTFLNVQVLYEPKNHGDFLVKYLWWTDDPLRDSNSKDLLWGVSTCALKIRETGFLASSLSGPNLSVHLERNKFRFSLFKPKGNILGLLSEISTGLPQITNSLKHLIPQGKSWKPQVNFTNA